MKTLVLGLVILLSTSPASAAIKLLFCDGQTATNKWSFKGTIDPQYMYVGTMIITARPRDGGGGVYKVIKGSDIKMERFMGAFSLHGPDFHMHLPPEGGDTNVHFESTSMVYKKPSGTACTVSAATENEGLAAQMCYDHYDGCRGFMQRHDRMPTLEDRSEVIWGPDLKSLKK